MFELDKYKISQVKHVKIVEYHFCIELERSLGIEAVVHSASCRMCKAYKVQAIEKEGLECVVSQMTHNDYGVSKWYQPFGKKTARSHS